MVEPNQIITGDVLYTLEDFITELKDAFKEILIEKSKDKSFKSMFMFILLSSENKPVEIMMKIFLMSKEQVFKGQEIFKKEIDIVRAIQMKKYLDLYKEYFAGQKVTLNLLNLWIKEFLDKHIKGVNNGTT